MSEDVSWTVNTTALMKKAAAQQRPVCHLLPQMYWEHTDLLCYHVVHPAISHQQGPENNWGPALLQKRNSPCRCWRVVLRVEIISFSSQTVLSSPSNSRTTSWNIFSPLWRKDRQACNARSCPSLSWTFLNSCHSNFGQCSSPSDKKVLIADQLPCSLLTAGYILSHFVGVCLSTAS